MESCKEVVILDENKVKKKSIFTKKDKSKINLGKSKKEEKKIKKNIVAFDIGSSNIKIVEGSYNKNKLIIENCIKIVTPKNSMVEGEVAVKDAITSMIGAALRQYNIKSKDAICTTNPTSLISREIIVPKVDEDELETVVRFEIQQYLPINLDDCILQTTILSEFTDELEGKKKYNVRVVVYQKRVALEYYKLLTDLNLRPYTLDVNFNALNKIINYTGLNNEYDDKSSIAMFDMGENFIDVNIYKGDSLDFTRRIKFGGKDIEDTLIQDAGISYIQAKEIKFKKIDLGNERLSIKFENKIIQNCIDELIDKIEMIFQFYKNKDVENDIKKVYIFGGTSKLKGIEKYMSDKLNVQVMRINDISNVTLKKNIKIENNISDYLNAIGSIIRL